MSLLLHSTIIATSLAATIAVGFASASIYSGPATEISTKADRLPIVANASQKYILVEIHRDGISEITRMPIAN